MSAQAAKAGLSILGGVVGAYGAYQGAKEEARSYKFNAAQARQEAAETMRRLEVNKKVRTTEGISDRTSNVITAGSSGFSAHEYSSSALAASLQAELTDIISMQKEAEYTSMTLNTQANEYERAAKYSKKAGKIAAVTSILNGVAGAAG